MRKLIYAGIILSFSFLLIAAGCQVTQQPPTTAPALSQAEVISSTAQFTKAMLQLDASVVKWANDKKVSGMIGVGVQTTGIHAMTTTEVNGWTRTTEESTTVAGTYKSDYYYQERKDNNGNLTDVILYGRVSLDTGATGSAVRGSTAATGSTSSLTMGQGVSNPPQRPTSSDPPNGVNPIHIQYTYENSNQLSTYSISGYVAFKIVDNQTHKQTLFVVTNLNITGKGVGDNFLPENGTLNISVTTTTSDNQSSTQTLSLRFVDGKIYAKYDGLPETPDLMSIINWFVPSSTISLTVDSGQNSWQVPSTLWIYAIQSGSPYDFNNGTAITSKPIIGPGSVTVSFSQTTEVQVFAVVYNGDHPLPEFIFGNDHGFAGEYADNQFAPMGIGSPTGIKGPKTISISTQVQF